MSNQVFDQNVHAYDKLLQQNIGLYGKDVSYYAEHKAIILSQYANCFPDEILEYGCGVGRNIPYLQYYFPTASVYGYDISPESLAAARKRCPQFSYFQRDQLLQQGMNYDLILVANVFHHIEIAERLENLFLIKSLLKSGGEVFFIEHNPFNPLTRYAVDTCPLDNGAELLAPDELENLITEVDLRIVRQKFTLFFPSSLKFLQPLEKYLSILPFGGQYFMQVQKSS